MLFHDFYVHIVFMCCIVLNVVGLYLIKLEFEFEFEF